MQYDYEHPRSALSITISVWNALFLREANTRLSAGRIAWVWLLLEPLLHITVLILLFTFIRMRTVSGMDTPSWLIIGITFNLVFQRTYKQVQNAVNANRGLFTYRQVKIADTLFVRGFLEGFITLLIAVCLGLGASFFGLNLIPDEPLLALVDYFGMWLMGVGYGLITSVTIELIPKVNIALDFFGRFLYLTSGVIFPVANIPEPYRSWILINPLLHGTEGARGYFSAYYHPVPGLELSYLYLCAIITFFFGLALHRRFEQAMKTK